MGNWTGPWSRIAMATLDLLPLFTALLLPLLFVSSANGKNDNLTIDTDQFHRWLSGGTDQRCDIDESLDDAWQLMKWRRLKWIRTRIVREINRFGLCWNHVLHNPQSVALRVSGLVPGGARLRRRIVQVSPASFACHGFLRWRLKWLFWLDDRFLRFSFVVNPLAPVQETLCLLQNETTANNPTVVSPQTAVSTYYMIKLNIRSGWIFLHCFKSIFKGRRHREWNKANSTDGTRV